MALLSPDMKCQKLESVSSISLPIQVLNKNYGPELLVGRN